MNFEDYESLPSQNPLIHMTAGAIAGVMEHCVMYPLDSVKTRMQSLRSGQNRTIVGTLRHMIKREGVLRPVRGMCAVVAGAGPAHACFFATYEHAKHLLQPLRGRHEHLTHGLSGCLASLVHDAVSNPTEVVKQRMQMCASPYRGVWECARNVYRAEGARAFYRSYGTQVLMSAPFHGVHVAMYERAQQWMNPARHYRPGAHAAAGALAAAAAAAATAPLDACRTLQNTGEADSLRQAAARLLAARGLPGFWRGLPARVLFQAPAAAICWLTYESIKHLLQSAENEDLPAAVSNTASNNINNTGSATHNTTPHKDTTHNNSIAALRLTDTHRTVY